MLRAAEEVDRQLEPVVGHLPRALYMQGVVLLELRGFCKLMLTVYLFQSCRIEKTETLNSLVLNLFNVDFIFF